MTTTAAAFAYTDTTWPVLERMAAAHRRSWTMLASPGEWWTGAQRISIAARMPSRLCAGRRSARSWTGSGGVA